MTDAGRVRSLRMRIALFFLCTLSGCSEILVPSTSFEETPQPEAPDYGDEASWAALPSRVDPADVAPEGQTDAQDDAQLDVFFIHPTTYYSGASWNQPLDDETANDFTDRTMRAQASVFNGVARIYAPRYRQATLGAYLTQRTGDAEQAFELAYRDVREAFETYLERWSDGRPLIVAAHSQGSGHGLRLVSELISDLAGDPSLRDRLVAAYLIGAAVPEDALSRTLPGVPLCATPEQTGCAVFYNTIDRGARAARFEEVRVWYPGGAELVTGATMLCVNAVTWRADADASALEAHLGAVDLAEEEGAPEPAILTAQCAEGLLEVELSDSDWDTIGGDQHVHDYALFYMDLRANAAARAAAFLAP
jgi:hypothetical protein